MSNTRRLLVLALALLMLAAACAEAGDDTDQAADDTATDADEASPAEATEAEATEAEATDGEDAEAAADVDQEWLDEGIRWLVASSAGGGFDRTTRQLQPYMEEELGTTMNIENRPGAAGTIAGTLLLEDETCNMVVTWGHPHLPLGQMIQDVDYAYEEDFYPVGAYTSDPSVIIVSQDAPWETMEEMIEDARANPGEITASIGSPSSDLYGLVLVEEATGVEFNIVPFDGGSEARQEVATGRIPMTYASIFNSRGVADQVRYLAIYDEENPHPDLTDDAPPINEALGTDIPPQISRYGLFASRACRDQYPERFEALAAALENTVTNNEDFQAAIEEVGEAGWYSHSGPDEFDEQIIADLPSLQQFVDESYEG